jgi:hypothetical protein
MSVNARQPDAEGEAELQQRILDRAAKAAKAAKAPEAPEAAKAAKAAKAPEAPEAPEAAKAAKAAKAAPRALAKGKGRGRHDDSVCVSTQIVKVYEDRRTGERTQVVKKIEVTKTSV